LIPLGYLDVIGPDDRPCVSFPLTKRGEFPTRVGRTGHECDIALDDGRVSQVHARVWFRGGRWSLEDMGSRNGTFLGLNGRTVIRRGSERQAVADELLVGPYSIRVVDLRLDAAEPPGGE
jgi:pSer/pThr/pTyr-binding forkhead associated (FHA) protein